MSLGAVLVWHSLQYNFVTDDAYISFVYSRNFAEHGQLVFNVGYAPVEGYTNFLWTFVLGVLLWLGIPPEVSSLVLGTAFALATMLLVFRLTRHVFAGQGPWDLLAPALLAFSSGYACWSSGGLETQMFTFFVTLALFAYTKADSEVRWFRRVGMALALAAMTRPEGLLVAAVLGGHRLILNAARDRRLVPNRFEMSALGVFLLVWAPWFGWRFLYYGHPFPNTYYVKAAGEVVGNYHEVMGQNGRYYVWQWLTQSKALFAAPVAVLGLLWAKPRTSRFVFGTAALALAGVYLLYTMRVGGDFMGLHRFVMPVFVVVAVGTAMGLRVIVERFGQGRARLIAGSLVSASVVAVFAVSQMELTAQSIRWQNWQSDHGIDTPSYLATYAHDRAVIGKHLRECFRDDDFSIFGGVGAKPYFSRAKGIDVFGLVSDVVAHKVPRSRPRAGHNKWAPDKLLLEAYEPTFVFHCYSLHKDPAKPSINCPGRFWQSHGYEQVTLHVPGLLERGEYYTFFVREDRAASFRETCPGVVP